MKRFWRIVRHRFRTLERSLRGVRERLTAARALLILEAMLVGGALVFALTGDAAVALDNLSSRADFWSLVVAVALLMFLYVFVNPRIAPALDARFAIARYDDRRILFDLGHAARGVTNVGELYKLVADKIEEALHTSNVSIFVRDDATGDYTCRICSRPREQGAKETDDEAKYDHLTLARDSFVVKRLRNLAIPLGIEPRDFVTWSRALVAASPRVRQARETERETLESIGSRLMQGVMMRDQLVGIISLGARAGNRPFTAEDKQLLIQVAGQTAFIIENSKLVERMVEEERLRRELALAAEVQSRLFPAHAPEVEGLELSGFCQPAREVGGDYYDFLSLDNDQTGIAVADVAGKGISAALLMSIVQASLRSQAMALNPGIGVEGSLADLVRMMNRLVWRSTGASSYVTFFYAQFDDRTRRLTYTNAGHNPPLLIRAKTDEPKRATESGAANDFTGISNHARSASAPNHSGDDHAIHERATSTLLEDASEHDGEESGNAPACISLTTGGPVLGIFDDCYYEQETIEARAGDVLVAYTDGVTEAMNADGEEFGEARLQTALTESVHLPADEIRAYLVERLRAWSAGTPPHDDLTFIVMKVK